SFAHGGKDRHTFPAPLKVYDETIRTLKSAVRKCKARRDEELGALKRLDDQARSLGQHVSGPSVEEMISPEFQTSHAFGGRSAPSLSGASLLATEADVTKGIDL